MMQDTTMRNGFRLGDISKDFRHVDEGNAMDVSAILSLTNGIISCIAAFPMSGAAKPALTALSGLFGLGTEIADYLSPEKVDHRLDDWAKLSSQYVDTLDAVLDAWQRYYVHSLSDPAAFVAAIGSGKFASHVAGSPHWDTTIASNMIKASVISSLWIQQKVFVVRFTKPIKLANGETFDFCGSKNEAGEHGWKEASHCAGNNINYIIVSGLWGSRCRFADTPFPPLPPRTDS